MLKKIRALKISSSSSRASKSLIKPIESGPQKCNIFVLDVSLVLLLPLQWVLQILGIFESLLNLSTLPGSARAVIVQGMTPWHIWDQILSVWLGKSLWVTSRGERCLQIPDPPTRQDPGAPASEWGLEIHSDKQSWIIPLVQLCHLRASRASFSFYHFIVQ